MDFNRIKSSLPAYPNKLSGYHHLNLPAWDLREDILKQNLREVVNQGLVIIKQWWVNLPARKVDPAVRKYNSNSWIKCSSFR